MKTMEIPEPVAAKVEEPVEEAWVVEEESLQRLPSGTHAPWMSPHRDPHPVLWTSKA